MPVAIKGSGGGSVTLDAGSAASDTTLTLPNTTGTVALTASPVFTGSITTPVVSSLPGSSLTLQSGGTTAMTIDTLQNVGIGTISPTTRFQINGTSGQAPAALISSAQTGTTVRSNSVFRIQSEASGRDVYMQFSDNVANATEIGMISGNQYFCTSGSEKMRIDSSGNVGIGTTSPSSYGKFAAIGTSGSTQAFIGVGSDGWAFNTFSSGSAYLTYSAATVNTAAFGTASNIPLAFLTNNSERVRITNNGEFWWNCYPTRPHLATGSNVTGFQISTQYGVEVNNRDALVGIFNRTNSTGAIVEWKYNANVIGSVSTNGSSTSYNTSSDYRLKTNVEPITTGLATVSALKPVTYKWTADDSDGEGFLAHELQEVIPLAVTGEKDAVNADGSIKPQGVDYSKIVVHLVAAIQELKADLDAAKAEIASLKGAV